MNHLSTTHYKKKISRKLFRMLLLFFLPSLGVYGQEIHEIKLDVPRIVPVSPEAVSMEKYQSYPIDYCTGIPNITIPLYEIVAGEVTIPINLSYHASGMKPKERSGLVGTGWTLDLEPSIMREIKGVADDDTYGWFNRHNSSPPSDRMLSFIYYNEKVDNKRDTQPDKFVYKLPSGGGSGYFTESYNPLRTIPCTNDYVRYRGVNMDITDGSGMKYEFNGVNEKSGNYVTRWMCTAIRSPRQVAPLVTFNYSNRVNYIDPGSYFNLDSKVVINQKSGRDGQVMLTKQVNNLNLHYRVGTSYSMGDVEPYATTLTSVSESQAGVHYPLISRYITGRMTECRLESVDFFGNTLSVTYGSTGASPNNTEVYRRLDVTNNRGEKVRSIEFFITPYNNATSLTKLDSVRISAPGAENKVYSFRYNNPHGVPSIYTVSVDHWGFCNGANDENYNQLTVPSFREIMNIQQGNGDRADVLLVNQGVNREPDHNWTRVGVLERITNPQGIETDFTYEGNFGAFRDHNHSYTYEDYLHPVGGLRVKSISVRNPHTGKRTIKSYQYGLISPEDSGVEPVWGGGAIKHIVSSRDYRTSTNNYVRSGDGRFYWFEQLITYSSMPHSNIAFDNGSAAMYNIVREVVSSDETYKLRTDYYYDVKCHAFENVLSWSDGSSSTAIKEFFETRSESELRKIFLSYPFHPQGPSDHYVRHYSATNQRYGKLLRKVSFKGDEPVSRMEYFYKAIRSGLLTDVDLPVRLLMVEEDVYRDNPSSLSDSRLFVIGNHYIPNASTDDVQTTYYLDIDTYWSLDRETSTEYYTVNSRRDSLTVEKNYSYRIRFTDPGVSLRPRKVDIVNSAGGLMTDEYDYLEGYPDVLSSHKHIEGERYEESDIVFREGTSFPERVRTKTDRNPDYRDEVIYTAYDAYNNVAEIRGKDGMPVAFLWGYENRFPIAKIENATRGEVLRGMGYSESSTTTLESWSQMIEPNDNIRSKIDILRTTLPTARVTTYSYDSLNGVASVTDPNGVTTCFEYDNYSRLTDSYYLSPDLRKIMLQQHIYRFGN